MFLKKSVFCIIYISKALLRIKNHKLPKYNQSYFMDSNFLYVCVPYNVYFSFHKTWLISFIILQQGEILSQILMLNSGKWPWLHHMRFNFNPDLSIRIDLGINYISTQKYDSVPKYYSFWVWFTSSILISSAFLIYVSIVVYLTTKMENRDKDFKLILWMHLSSIVSTQWVK